MLLQPLIGIEEEELLAPQHASECLPHHLGRIFAHFGGRDRLIERIGLATTLLDDFVEPATEHRIRHRLLEP
jgi:hypothetical protein